MNAHNHANNFGIPVDGCPRCEELKVKPYVLTYKLGSDKKIQRVAVSSVTEAKAIIQARLPDTSLRVPVVETPSGQTVAILQIT